MFAHEVRWLCVSEHNFNVKYMEKMVITHFLMKWRNWLMGELVLIMTNHSNRSDLAMWSVHN